MKIHHASVHNESIAAYPAQEFTCKWCDEIFSREVRPEDTRSFCSQSCASKYRHKERGNNLYNGAGGPKKRALERDNYTCQRCGDEVEDGHRKSPKSGEVHHIIPRAAGGPDALPNLVTLCLRCHKEAHRDMGEIHEYAPDVLKELQDVVCEG